MFTAIVCGAGVLFGTAAPVAAASPAIPSHYTVRHLCSTAQRGNRACFALKLVPSAGIAPAAAAATPSGFGPADLAGAYKLPATGGSGVTVAIVDAYNDPTAEADLAAYRSTYGLPACTTANGCFSKVSQTGSTTALPATNTGWAGEIALDIDMVSAGCPLCHILLVEAKTASNANLDIAVDYAAAHAQLVSNSYGGSETSSDTTDTHYNHPGVTVLASSGDEGYVVEFPAASPSVVAVGGTSLQRTSTARGWTESVWNTSNSEGAGSGCSAVETKPSWQTDTGCSRRTVADVSAVADPATGVAVYDTTGGTGWAVYGGTSVSSPLVAAILSITGHAGINASYLYAHPTFLYDVTSGQTATSCTSYLCKAGTGYDGPTGLGTPNGALLAGGTAPSNDFSIVTSPSTGTVAAGNNTTTTVSTAVTAGSAQSVALSASGLPAGVTASFSPATVTAGASSTLTISTTSAAAAGSSTVTITGTAASGTHTATYGLTVSTTVTNDFGVAASSASVVAGSSGTSSISTTTTSGSAQTISLSASGAPAGVTVTFNPASVTSGSSSTATITVPAATAAGSYTVTVTGTAASGTHTATIPLTVTSAGTTCTAGQKLANPGFESGAASWTATSGVINTNGTYARTGTGYAWLDGYGSTHTDSLSQSVTIPTGCSTAVVSFWTKITTAETTTTTAYDKLTVSIGGTTLATYSNLNKSTAYVQRTFNLTGYAGKSVTLTFKGVEDSSLQTSFFIDDTALTVS